jgi:hypothetical protein
MFSFRCEWLDERTTLERSGFDLGHMTFTGEQGSCTSHGKSPAQAMMLAIALKELLHGLEMFLRGTQSKYEFVGTDSSFSVCFQKGRRGRITVRCGRTELGEVESAQLCEAVLAGVEAFVTRPGNELPESDPVHEDLFSSIQRFKQLAREAPLR